MIFILNYLLIITKILNMFLFWVIWTFPLYYLLIHFYYL